MQITSRHVRRLLIVAATSACVASPGRLATAAGQDVAGALGGVQAAAAGDPAIELPLRLPLRPVPGPIDLTARRAWTWEVGGAEGAPPTFRLLLDEAVDVTIADVAVRADRAVLWISPGRDDTGEPVFHVFGYLVDARTPAAAAAVGIRADALPVSAVIRPAGPVRLSTDGRFAGPPPADRFAPDREAAREALRRALAGRAPQREQPAPEDLTPVRPLEPVPQRRPAPEGESPSTRDAGPQPAQPSAEPAPDGAPAQTEGVPPRPEGVETRRPIFASDGVISFSAGDDVIIERGEERNAVTLLGGIVVQYQGVEGQLELTAERGVIFLRPGPLPQVLGGFGVEDVRGVYLEDAVRATDGDYTLRAQRVYYDVRQNRAVALDAVFWTYEERVGLPLYMRADVIRQRAASEFNAEEATFSNTAFFEPHFAVGVRDLTVTRREPGGRAPRTFIDAKGVTLRAGDVPFFYWPRVKGELGRPVLRNIGFRDSNRQGVEINTEWDPFALLGIDRPEGLDVALDLDFFGERGVGLGGRAAWDRDDRAGEFTAYVLPNDDGDDITVSGEEVELDGETRALFVGQDRWEITPRWTLRSEVGFVSDETLTLDLFEGLGRDGDEVTTRTHLQRQEGNDVFTLEVRGEVNDFIVNQHRLQTPGYVVDKLPEIEFESLANDSAPLLPEGLLTHTWGIGFSSQRLRFSEVSAASQGFSPDSRARRAFGIDSDQSLGDAFRAQGLDESIVNRFDTRHEVTMPLNAGPLRFTPFAVGRFTAYDSDFSGFSPEEEDNARVWWAGGAWVSTEFHRVDNSVESRVFDLHRIRHIIEPSVTLWHAETNVSADDLPVFDDDVELLGDGSLVRVGVDQTWQTKRGGPGRWRSVDVLEIDAEYVWAADSASRGTPIGRFFDFRPELGNPQTFGAGRFIWRASEVAAITGEAIYDPGRSQAVRQSIGLILTGRRGFEGRVGFRRIEPTDGTYLDGSVSYLFADKYETRLRSQWDFQEGDFRDISAVILRDFPIGQFGFSIGFDNITDETSVGVVVRPLGVGGGSDIGVQRRGRLPGAGFDG